MYAILFVLVFAHERIELPTPIPAPEVSAAELFECHKYADKVADRFIAMFPKIQKVTWTCLRTA